MSRGGDRFLRMVENANIGMLQLTPAGQLLFANNALARILGYDSPEQLVTATVNAFRQLYVDPDLCAECMRLLEESGTVSGFEAELYRRDGSTAWLTFYLHVCRDSDGKVLWYEGMATDVTELRRAREAVTAREHQLKTMIDSAHDAILVADDDAIYIEANPAACDLLGLPREALIGRSVREFLEPNFDFDKSWKAFREQKRERGELRLVRPDGGIRYVEYTSTVDFLPGRHVAFMRDITDRKRAEEALRRSEELFRFVTTASPVGIYLTDKQGRCIYTNPRCQEIGGFSFEEALGQGWMKFVHPEDRDRVMEQTCGPARAGQAFSTDYRFLRNDGTFRWVKAGAAPILSDDGEFIGLVGTVEDITDHKRIDEALQSSEERYRTLVEMAPDVIYSIAPDGTFSSLSPAFERTTGWPISEWLGKPFTDILHHEDVRAARWRFHELLKGRTPPPYELRVRTKSGQYLVVELRSAPRIENGSVTEVVGIARDITQRRREQARLQLLVDAGIQFASSLNFETTLTRVAHMAVPSFADWCSVHMVSEDGKIHRLALAHVDPAKAVMATRPEYSFKIEYDSPNPVARVLRSGKSGFYPDVTEADIRPNVASEAQLDYLLKLGFKSCIVVPLVAHRQILGALSFVLGDSGRRFNEDDLALAEELARRAGLAMDNARLYREAQRVEAELRRANEAKDEFLGMVSHELRTSVTTIYGGANLLLSRASELDDETRISVLTDIRHESEQLVRMVRDMLLLARTELGQEIATEPVLIQRLIDRLIALRAVSNPRRRITLQADAELAPVVAEPAFLEQVLRNLLDNAEKYSPADTPVEIHVQRLDDEVVVCVADRGVGVPQDELEMIFDRFYRSTQSARSARGMGIGLSVCKRLVEAQGGRIWAEQREEGGLRVCFTLPFYRGDPDYL